jgi:hypothetical protein
MATKRKLWAWDIESVNWDEVRCVVAVSDDGDVERWSGPHALEACDRFMRAVGGTWCAHAGGIYDTLLLSNVRPQPWRELIMSGAAVLCATDRALKVRDTFRWWLSSLAKVGAYVDKVRGGTGEWRKRDVDRSRIDQLSDSETLAYCEHDCRLLLEGVRLARSYMEERGARPAWTAGASALSLLETLEPASWELLRRHQLPHETATAAGACVRGARVECFARGRIDRVFSYDLKSAYPAAYTLGGPVGIGAEPLAAGDADRPGAVWRCRWEWPWRDRLPPALDALTGAGHGRCEAWLVPEERAAFEAAGVLLRRLEGWAPVTIAPIGQTFARTLYAEKEAGSFFGKCYLNSLHGKFSESPIKETWTRDHPAQYYGPKPEQIGGYWRYLTLSADRRGLVPRHVQPLSAAQILGRTRARIWSIMDAITRAGGRVYYSDTDSVHCSLSPDQMPVPLGGSLGELAYEGGPFVGYYVAPKAYLLCDPTTGRALKGALKGMPLQALADGVQVAGAAYDDDGVGSGAAFWSSAATPRYRGARGQEKGSDMRVDVFKHALSTPGGVQVEKEGLPSWTQGARAKLGWRRATQIRTLQPVNGPRRWQSADSWEYLSPSEYLGRDPYAEPLPFFDGDGLGPLWD